MSKIDRSKKNELCLECGATCWQYKGLVIHSCNYIKKSKEGKKLADKLYKEFTKS